MGSKSGKTSVVSKLYKGFASSLGGGIFSAGCCPVVPIASASLLLTLYIQKIVVDSGEEMRRDIHGGSRKYKEPWELITSVLVNKCKLALIFL